MSSVGGRTFASLAVGPYRILWLSMIASFLGNQMHIVARGFLALNLTGQASSIGWVMASWGLPMLAFSLLGGAVADRFDRKRVLVIAQAGQGLMGLGIAFLLLFGALEMWHLIVAGVWQGTMFSFNGPARQALIPELVDDRLLMNAIALNNAAMNLTRVVGPTLAGVMIAIDETATMVYFFMASTYVVVLLLLMLGLPDADQRAPNASRDRERLPMWQEMKAGLRYVFVENRLIAGLIVVALVPVLIGWPYQMLLPVFQEDVFHVDPKGLGFMYTVGGVGALAGSLLVAAFSEHPKATGFQVGAGVVFGLSLAAFAFSPNFWLACGLLVLVGLSSMTFMALNNTQVMAITEPDYHGRVMSVYMLTWSLMPLGGVPISFLTDRFGAPLTVGVSGIVVAIFMTGASKLLLGASRARSRGRLALAAGDGGG